MSYPFNRPPSLDGVDIHFLHVRSPHEHALPLVITHGWPGSVIELLEVVGPLTDPTAYGGEAADAFDLVLPSVPGYGFSGQPAEVGWDPGRTGRAWAELMGRLGLHTLRRPGWRGGRGRHRRDGAAGTHRAARHSPQLPAEPAARAGAGAVRRRPGPGWDVRDGAGGLTRERIVDNITLYWLTASATSAARMYWENVRSTLAAFASGQPPAAVSLPVGYTVFPDELIQAPRSWAEKVYPNLVYSNEVDRGGHFAAWEEPELFSNELRAAFRPLRR